MLQTETPGRRQPVGCSNANLSGPRDENQEYNQAPKVLGSSPEDLWGSFDLPDPNRSASCLLPPSVMRALATRPSPVARLDVLEWAHYMGWSSANLHALASWMLEISPPHRHNGTPADEVASAIGAVRGSGQRDERNEPEGARALSTPETVRVLRQIRQLGAAHDWQGRTAGSDRALFLAICDEALGAVRPGLRLPFSVRRAAEVASVTANTASRALGRLVAGGYLLVVRRDSFVSAVRYEVHWPFGVRYLRQWFAKIQDQAPGTENTVVVSAPSVVWSCAVLGRTRQRLVECLSLSVPSTDRAWYEAARVSRRSFYEVKSSVLDQYGLVVRDSDGAYRQAPDLVDRLDRVARELGAVERHARKVQRHALDRDAFGRLQLAKAGLDGRFTVRDGKFIDRTTGEVVRRDDVFSRARRERATRPVGSEWCCPLVPAARWRPPVAVPVQVRARRAVAA